MQSEFIVVLGAKEHNLKNIDVKIPKNKLVVITGLSGSGKSSLAFDTIYAEGQRRYIETFSAYGRKFLGIMERPNVDKIDGLSPVISIDQKTVYKNPRSTVGTITEIYDFLRVLYARCADAYSYETSEKMVSYTDEEIVENILEKNDGKMVYILSSVVRSRKGHYRELFEKISKRGFIQAFVDNELIEITKDLQLDRYKLHDIDIVIDKLSINKANINRISASVKTALDNGEGVMKLYDSKAKNFVYFSRKLMCPTTGISYSTAEPNFFSFNSPKGSCPDCKGLGYSYGVDERKIITDLEKSIKQGGITPLVGKNKSWIYDEIGIILSVYDLTFDTPIKNFPKEAIDIILYGGNKKVSKEIGNIGVSKDFYIDFKGIANFISDNYNNSDSPTLKRWAEKYIDKTICPQCKGLRLNKISLSFKIMDKNISELSQLDLLTSIDFIKKIPDFLNQRQNLIAREILKEISLRVNFLIDLGLGYLSLSRTSDTLSGGEAQRIRLTTQIGSQLVGVTYILDEPSIGLHQIDNIKLISSLKKLRDLGNSVIVVEHDKEVMEHSDYILDMGPFAGVKGGEIVAQGTLEDIKSQSTLTAQYLNNSKAIEIPEKRRCGTGKDLILKGAKGNNLKNIDVVFPLGKMICITGVSGSGKSSLINGTLYPILSKHFYNSVKEPLSYGSIEGIENIDKVVNVNQDPIGRTPRSNPATYVGVLSDIRSVFSVLPDSKIRGYKSGRFSFNVPGGRCESCKGAGVSTLEMHFLPDVYVCCESCNGNRFNRETLEIKYKGKSISDVLNMTVNTAVDFFKNIPKVYKKLKTMRDVGLGYITLGQPSNTISGGEAQRLKLALELSKRHTGKTLYILDEPTTGLHFEDIKVLLDILNKLVEKQNTVIVIEHNMDVIKVVDHIIDIGPKGGVEGGNIVCFGTPESIAENTESSTTMFLKKELNLNDTLN
ncbi:excinuclease ABC subunit UvrA [Ichthyobacterium seriolicida]|uniref:UvrABC system protein A n=1 Tax=Ichthyobacterium seriolicida TaxID=242600 RepID=A0A1J1DXK0_9FLAO|nr:excinuclease ABC subunit UvrA [Ichthyobacterium seriolicida]BAV94583.1 excinuclease ABC subunit A [Ichthyobacterium seriolicida]